MTATITNIFLKTGSKTPMKEPQTALAVAGKGLDGDVSYGRTKRQVLFVERETLDVFGLQPGQVRENITVAGLQLAGTTPGTRLQVGDTVMEVTMDCAPCEFMNELKPCLRVKIDGRRGTLCKVISGGEIKVGDGLKLLEPEFLTAHH